MYHAIIPQPIPSVYPTGRFFLTTLLTREIAFLRFSGSSFRYSLTVVALLEAITPPLRDLCPIRFQGHHMNLPTFTWTVCASRNYFWFRRVVPRIINRSIHVDLHSYDPRRGRSL